MRIKNLIMRKPEGGFRGLTAVLPSFCLALALFAAGVMVPAGCDNPAGVGNGYEAASGPGPEDAGGTIAVSSVPAGAVNVKFKVLNGGWGLRSSEGMVGAGGDAHDAYLVRDYELFARDYDITIPAQLDDTTITLWPSHEEYVSIHWKGVDISGVPTYLHALMKIDPGNTGRKYTVVIDYNGVGKVATKNLVNVIVTKDSYHYYDLRWRSVQELVDIGDKNPGGTR